jgi:metal-sulfur cluster biosynthetic enzyme
MTNIMKSMAKSTVDAGAPLAHRVEAALASIPDPELGIDIYNLGLIGDIQIDGGHVRVEYTLTRLGCPAAPLLREAILLRVSEVEGVESVEAELVFHPAWTPERMSGEARAQLFGEV